VRVLGIDPGLRVTGFGVVEGSASRPAMVDAGAIRLGGTRPESVSIAGRLVELERDLVELIAAVRPDCVAVEEVFSHAEFPATAIKMGHARGVVLLCAQRAGLEIVELAPKSIKQAVTGSGRASKEQIQRSVQTFFGLAQPPEPADVADALAIGVAALSRMEAAAGRGSSDAP